MSELSAADPELGRDLFHCRARPLRSFFVLRYQGSLPLPGRLNPLSPFLAVTSAVMESLLLAGVPTILLIFGIQVVLGLKPPNEPLWVRPVCFAFLALAAPG